jgi:hypothetical protein
MSKASAIGAAIISVPSSRQDLFFLRHVIVERHASPARHAGRLGRGNAEHGDTRREWRPAVRGGGVVAPSGCVRSARYVARPRAVRQDDRLLSITSIGTAFCRRFRQRTRPRSGGTMVRRKRLVAPGSRVAMSATV